MFLWEDYQYFFGSSEIWSDKLSLLHIRSHREGENTEVKADNITEVPKAQRATEP